MREQDREERKKRVGIIILCVILLVIGSAIVIFAFLWDDIFLKEKHVTNEVERDTLAIELLEETYSREEVEELLIASRMDGSESTLLLLKQLLDDGMSAVEAFRRLYKDELVIASNGKYNFIPIRDDLKKHSYEEEHLTILENGTYQYEKDGVIISHKGIDVSKFQGKIDWEQVASDGIEFAFIRVGLRGYGSGKLVEDEQFEANIKGANEAGVKVGVYFFSQAINEEEVLEEAQFVLDKIAPYKVECPVVFDVEKVANSSARMNKLSTDERTYLTKLFCKTIEDAGYQSMIYCNLEMAAMMLNLKELEAYEKWFAYYNPNFYYPYEFKVWQYSEKGKVAGIKELVDLNISFAPLWE